MGRFSSLFDTKQQEENRKLVQGYIAERARRTEGSVARPASPISNTSPSTQMAPPAQTSPLPAPKTKQYQDRWLASRKFQLSEKQIQQKEKIQAEKNMLSTPAVTAPTSTTLSKEALANLQSYQKSVPESHQEFVKGHIDGAKPLVRDAYENTREYQYLNNLSKKPIVGGITPYLGDAMYSVSRIGSGIEGITNIGEQFMSPEKISPDNMLRGHSSNAVREGSQRVFRNLLGMKYDGVRELPEQITDFVTGTALDATSSAVNSLLFGRGGLALAAGNAANQEFIDSASNDEITRDQMLLSGLAKGTAEAAWEFAPQSRFLEMAKNGLGTTGKEVLKNVLKQSGQEFFEEAGTELTNTISDFLIKGKQSDVAQEYLARRQAGESDKEAIFNTAKGIAANVGMSGLGGALSGGFSTGLAGMSNTVRNGFAYSGMNGTYQDIADSADTSTEEGKAIHEVATRLAEKEAKGQKVSLMDRGYLGNAIDNAAIEASKQAETNNSTLEAETSRNGEPVQSEEGNNAPYNVLSNNQTEDSIREEGSKAVAPELSNRIQQIDSTRKAMEQNALHEFSGNYDTEGKQAFMKNYDGSLDLPTYIKAYNDIYNIARYNYKTGHEDLQTGAVKTARMALLSEAQRKEIYKAGFRDLMATEKNWNQNFKERVEKREGGVMDSVPHAPKNLITVLNALGKNTGLLFRITDSKYADGANGSYEKGKGIITIDLQSDNVLGTVAHEMTHWLKDYNEIAYPMFRGHVVESLVRSSGTDFDTLKEAYRNSYGQNMTEEEIVDEIVADATTRFLNDEKLVKEILADKETKGFAAKILDWIKSVIDAYKELISHTGDRRASLALQEDLKRYEEARELWSYGIEEATQNMKKYEPVTHAEDSEAELSRVQLQKLINNQNVKTLSDRIDDVLTNQNFTESHVYLGDTPQILQNKLGFRDLPILMTSKHVYSDIKTEREAKNENRYDGNFHYHGLGKNSFVNAIKALKNPDFILKSTNDPNNLRVAIGVSWIENKKRNNAIIAIQPEGSGYYQKIEVESNIGLSAYEKNNLSNFFNTALKNSRVLYIKGLGKNNNGTVRIPGVQFSNNPNSSAVNNSLNKYKQAVNQFLKKNGKVQQTNQNNGGNGLLKQLDISEEYYHALEEENSELKKANNYLSEVLNAEKSHVPSQSDVRKTADRMLDEFKSSFKKSDLVEQLTGLYQYLKESKNIDGGEVTRVSRSIAREVIDNAQYQDEDEVREYKAFKGFFDKRPLYIPEEYIEDIYPDGFGALRKKYFGKVDIRKANADHQNNIYDIYRELQQEFPNQFPEHDFTSNDADVALEILDGFEQLRPKDYEHFPGEEYNHAVDRLADEIFNAYFEVGEESLNNKYKKSYKKLKEDARASLEQEYREKYEAKLEKYIAKAEKKDEKSVARIKALRADYKDSLIDYDTFIREEARILKKTGLEYQARRELHQAYREKQDEQRHRQIYKREIVRDSKALMNMAVNPTDNLHVPKVLLKDLVPVLSSVDFSSVNTYDGKLPKISMTANEFAKNLETLNRRLQEAENNGDIFTEKDGKGMYLHIDPDLKANLQEIQEAVEGIGGNMNRLSTEQLQTLRNSLRGLKKIVESQNKFISENTGKRMSDIVDQVIDEYKKQKTGTDYVVGINEAKNFLKYEMLDAPTFFHELGDGGDSMYKVLRHSLDKKTSATIKASDYFEKATKELNISEKDIKKMSETNVKVMALDKKEGVKKEINISKAQIISAYLDILRDQARMHLLGEVTDKDTSRKTIEDSLGGFVLPDRRVGLVVKRDKTVYKLTEAEINTIIQENLTENEIALAEKMRYMYSKLLSSFGNEASNAVYGYDKFLEKNYVPIKVDSDSLTMKNSDLEKMMVTLKNKGFTKSLQKEAYNALVLEDAFDVLSRHMDEMTTYYAYFPAIIDLQKFYNMTDENGDSVHREMSRVMGKGGTDYFMNLIRDLNGGRGDESTVGKLAYGTAGLYKGALVGGNLRVAIQQPMSYARAWSAIEGEYLLKGLSLPLAEANKEWELAKKYAPIAAWKAMGSYDINLGTKSTRTLLTGEETKLEKARNATFWLLEKGDEFAWKRLWYAAEKKVEGTTNLKKGTEEYYKAAAEIFNDVIDQTQDVDTVLNRTSAMKSKDGLAKVATSFMSEPSKTYNVVYRAYSDYKKGKIKADKFIKTLMIGAIGQALVSAAASLLSAMRSKDKEKKFGDRYVDLFLNDYANNIKFWNTIPIIGEKVEAALASLAGKRKFSSGNDFATKPIEDVMTSIRDLADYINGDSKVGLGGTIYKMSNAANALGIPLHNILRDAGAVFDTWAYDISDDADIQYFRDKAVFRMEAKNNRDKYVNVNRFLSSALKAYSVGDKNTGDKIIKDMQEKLGDDFINEKLEATLAGDETIAEMAQKKLDGVDSSEEREYLHNHGYSDSMIDGAVTKAFQELKPIKDDELAEQLFERSEGYKETLDNYVNYQIAKGNDSNEIRKSIKAAVTKKYKQAYVDAIGNPAESDAILKKILRITYDGKQLYTEKDLKQWAKK